MLYCIVVIVFLFFFQAEDGIRDRLVTGVQTCALPIYERRYHLDNIQSAKGLIFPVPREYQLTYRWWVGLI